MGRISFNVKRCDRCKMHQELCVCSHIPTLDLATQILLIMHKREYVKVSATGPLALECLPNSELLLHGYRESPLSMEPYCNENRRLLMLFPRPGAAVLNRELVDSDPRPITLVVPDGNWGQASRMSKRIPGIENATNVVLPEGQQTQWKLRHEPHKEGLATFEAISAALGIIESPAVQQSMNALFKVMVQRTLKLRGTRTDRLQTEKHCSN